MRFILVAAAITAAMLLRLPTSQAYYEGPWCAVTNVGHAARWNCSMPSIEVCRQEVIAGNRGWCNPNPRWGGALPTEGRSSRKRHGY